jgi:hypothetical protein
MNNEIHGGVSIGMVKAVSQLGWLKVKFLIVVNIEFKYFPSHGASEII